MVKIILSFLDKNKDTIIFLLSIIVVYLLFSLFRVTIKYNKELSSFNKEKENFRIYVDKLGKQHAEIKDVNTEITFIDKSIYSKLDSLTKILKVKPKEVTRYVTVDFEISKDSSKEEKFFYKDKANLLFYTKPKRFLGLSYKKEDYLDVTFDNPGTEIKGLENINLTKEVRRKRFGIGLSAGYTYNFNRGEFAPYIGIGVNYNFIQF